MHSKTSASTLVVVAFSISFGFQFICIAICVRLISSRFVACTHTHTHTHGPLSGISFTEMIDERVFGLRAYTNRGEGRTRKKTQKKKDRSKYDGSGRKLFLTFNFLFGRLLSVDVHGLLFVSNSRMIWRLHVVI